MRQTHAVFEVPDGELDLGVPAMVGLQVAQVAVPVGDDRVVVVDREQRCLVGVLAAVADLGLGGWGAPHHQS